MSGRRVRALKQAFFAAKLRELREGHRPYEIPTLWQAERRRVKRAWARGRVQP